MEVGSQIPPLYLLNMLAGTVGQAKDPDEMYRRLLDGLWRCLGSDQAAIMLFDEERVEHCVASRGLSEAFCRAAQSFSPWPIDVPEPVPVLTGDLEDEPGLEPLRTAGRAEEVRSAVIIPLLYSGRLLGKMVVCYPAPRHFGDQDIEVARSLAIILSSAVEKKRTVEAFRAAHEALALSEAKRTQVWQTIDAAQQRIYRLSQRLVQVGEAERTESPGEGRQALTEFVDLTTQNIISSLGDLRQVIEVLLGQKGTPSLPGWPAMFLGEDALLEAVRDAIDVLDRTKRSFKSRELGSLRKRLEDVVRASTREATEQTGPQTSESENDSHANESQDEAVDK
jgi:uncharacterized protein YigA (DUF484 family)